ncbi:Hypothetical predicted protein [Paramuricea clavata]|uniref:Major facilitator superfamily associated domain-containing protein n=1 Tax=Paramuricea clavata TaxID=317549 RepID=A0A6S7G328_PARCT|nr:Hypothetical predicted protein [Paramuricea clavata]
MRSKQPWQINKDLFIYKSFYFFYFGALGAINPYLPVYLRQIGLSAFAVGLLVGIRPIVQLASAPFWTVVADKFRKRKAILVMSIMAWLIMTIALVFVEPTEEICEFTAKNSSHDVLVNYTKHKTGFFKRSTDRPVVLPARLARSIDILRGSTLRTPSVLSSRTSKDFRKNEKLIPGESNFRESVYQGYNESKNHVPETKSGQINDELFHTSHKEKENTGTIFLLAEQKDHKHLANVLLNMTKRLPSDLKSNNMSAAQNVSRAAHNMSSTPKLLSNIIPSSDDFQTSAEGSTDGQNEVLNPFNMNGKSKSSAGQNWQSSLQLHTIRAIINQQTAESQYVKSKDKTVHSSEVKYKRKKKKPDRNRTLKATKVKGGTKNTGIKLAQSLDKTNPANETLKVIQTNLFKSNTNEMKRLFVILLVLIVVGEFLETPSAPLSDASLLEYLGENRIHYGKQRLWGSLGHGIASFLVGMLMERSRHLTCGEEFIDYTTSFSVFTIFMLVTLVISANFKFRYKDVEETDSSVLSTVLTVHYISFLTAVCYMGMCHGLIHNFLMWFLEDLGGSKTLMGLAISSRNSADLIMFFIVSKLIEIFGQIKIVFIALISYGTIFIAYSTMSNPWFALGVEFLGGFTFAASWTACTSYLAEAAPQESVTTMQGILQSVYWGLGLGTGSILGGHLIHTLGPQWTFRAAATGSFVIASLFAATQWKWQRENLDDSLGIYYYFSSGRDSEALLQEDTTDRTLKITKTKDQRNVEAKRKVRKEKHEKKYNKRENP